jgi:HlyD family secretion protein
MIKNFARATPGRRRRRLALVTLLAWPALGAGCRGADLEGAAFQGVIEFDERNLGFEVTGRLAEVAVRAGDPVKEGTLIARLDSSLAKSALAARQSEARAAEDQLSLLRAGARGEDVRAMRARLEAAKSNEALLDRSLQRMRQLTEAGAATPAALDEADGQLRRAQAERRALEENLTALASGARRQEVEAAQHRLAAAQAAADLEKERLLRHELRSRGAGEVLEVHLEASEMAPAGVPVVTIADVEHPQADVFVPQARIGDVRTGARALGRVDGVAEAIAGKVELIFRRTEFTPRYIFSTSERGHLVVRVRVRFEDPGRRLHAGIPVFITLDAARGAGP